MKLISMTDFVLGIVKINYPNDIMKFKDCKSYANFLKKPLELWMFVAVDKNGSYFPEPESRGVHPHYITEPTNEELEKYNDWLEAKERCLFEGFEIIKPSDKCFILINSNNLQCQFLLNTDYSFRNIPLKDEIIEDLVKYNLELTLTAQKQIGL